MKITITKQEAIDAWKDINDHICPSDTVVEIEDYPYVSLTSTTSTDCLLCGKKGAAFIVHDCRGYTTYC